VFGPNFNLKPETGDSVTFGLEYSSEALPGLHTSLTWHDLKISNYIGVQTYETLLAIKSKRRARELVEAARAQGFVSDP
jgi:hypothetical protein